MFGTIASIPWMVFMFWEAIILQILYRILPLQRRVPEEEESVSGKVVVITGAGSGIGRYVATEMAKRGAIVVMGEFIKAKSRCNKCGYKFYKKVKK